MPAKKEAKEVIDNMQSLEPVFLMQDTSGMKSDVTVTFNGVNYQIQRGKHVLVPKFLKLVLDHSYRQQMAAEEYSQKLCSEYTERVDKLN